LWLEHLFIFQHFDVYNHYSLTRYVKSSLINVDVEQLRFTALVTLLYRL